MPILLEDFSISYMIPVFSTVENLIHKSIEEIDMRHEKFTFMLIHFLKFTFYFLLVGIRNDIRSTGEFPYQAAIRNELFGEDPQTDFRAYIR